MKYLINRKFPIPLTTGRNRYPFREMRIGDNIFVPEPNAVKARNAAYQFGINNGARFTGRKEEHLGEAGMRIWRIA